MIARIAATLAVCAAFALPGCGSHKVRVDSEPSGARLSVNGE